MHVLITGATGFIGKGALLHALVDDRVTKVTVVGRRLPSINEESMKVTVTEKLKVITRKDLSTWDFEQDTELVSALADCRACIWCVGGKAEDFSSPEEYERVSYTFTLNAAHFLSKLAQSQVTQDREVQPFRFCYCSGKWANRNGTASSGLFSIQAQTRNMKGRIEMALLSVVSQSNGCMAVYIFRPGGVIPHTTVTSFGGLVSVVVSAGLRMLSSLVIDVERLARVMVDASVGTQLEWRRQGADPEKNTWESEEIFSWSLGLGV